MVIRIAQLYQLVGLIVWLPSNLHWGSCLLPLWTVDRCLTFYEYIFFTISHNFITLWKSRITLMKNVHLFLSHSLSLMNILKHSNFPITDSYFEKKIIIFSHTESILAVADNSLLARGLLVLVHRRKIQKVLITRVSIHFDMPCKSIQFSASDIRTTS